MHRPLIGATLAALCACSSGSSGSAKACNALVDDGTTVRGARVAATAPDPAGGAIQDGTYSLTSMTEYTGPQGLAGILDISASAVLTISGSTMQQDGKVNGQETRYTTTITTSGTTITTSDICPGPSSGMHSYTATPTALSIYDSEGGSTLEQVYTRR